MKLIIDSAIPYIKGIFEPSAEVLYVDGQSISADLVRDADALIVRTRTRCDAKLLKGSRVKMVATATIGTDHIDLDWCRRNGIEVVSATGCNAAAVLQWVAATLVELVGEGNPEDYTLGVVGVGNVGSLVARYADQWGFKVLCNDIRPIPENTPLETLAERADIITFHVPLYCSTHRIIDSRIATCRATIINSSRGEIADEEALIAHSTRYCADVWCGEPDINHSLLRQALIATPHIAGYSAQGKANATAIVVNAIYDKFKIGSRSVLHTPNSLNWYPPQVIPIERHNISWQKLKESIKNYIDLQQLTDALKQHPEQFEIMRNDYPLRQEYF